MNTQRKNFRTKRNEYTELDKNMGVRFDPVKQRRGKEGSGREAEDTYSGRRNSLENMTATAMAMATAKM